MKGFVANIEELTEENSDFRCVLYTGKNLQLVLMAIEPGGEIGEEVHDDRDQFFRVEKGKGEVVIDGQSSKIKGDDAIFVPAGALHNIVNTGDKPLRGTRRRWSAPARRRRACAPSRNMRCASAAAPTTVSASTTRCRSRTTTSLSPAASARR